MNNGDAISRIGNPALGRDAATLEERFAAIKAKAVASGVRFVSEAELVANRLRREQRIRDRQAERSQARCERRAAKQVLRQQRDGGSNVRQVLAASEDDFTPADGVKLAALCRDAATSPGEREAVFQKNGGADSARAVLFEFLNRAEHWMVPFRSTDLEDYTREQGHGSSRMNNRARELREDFAPEGIYLDNDPNGSSAWCEGLPPGSYYRVCWTQDATSLTDQQKTEWLKRKKL